MVALSYTSAQGSEMLPERLSQNNALGSGATAHKQRKIATISFLNKPNTKITICQTRNLQHSLSELVLHGTAVATIITVTPTDDRAVGLHGGESTM